jgi:DNA-binding CsgD family transcriptional regulator
LPGGRHTHQVAAVSAAGGEALNNDVSLGDEFFDVAMPVGQCLSEHGASLPHSLTPIRSAGERWIVINKLRVHISVDGVQVALGEKLLDERLDELLVCGTSISCHDQSVPAITAFGLSQEVGISQNHAQEHTDEMTRRSSVVQVERDIVRYCHSGLDVAQLRKEVLGSLHRLMPVDAAFFATADPETLLFTGAYAEEPLAAVTPMFLANEFGTDDVNKFASLASSARHVATLDGATRRNRPKSLRSRDIMQPLGLGDELRAALMIGKDCWGYMCLHRDDHPLGFTSAEAAMIARLGPHIAHALRQATLLRISTVTGDTTAPGVVLLAEDLSVVAITPEAEHLISLINDGAQTQFPLPVAIYTVAVLLKDVRSESKASSALPSTRTQLIDGRWINVHASRLEGGPSEDRIAVVLEPLEARATVPLMLSVYGLSMREAEVAKLVLRGESTHAIVDALHISQHTVQDHLKAVFDKTGVHSRRDLVGRLLGQPILPHG